MNVQRFWLTAFVVLIAIALTDFIVHGVFLGGVYETSSGIMPREQYNVPVMILAYAVLAPVFSWIYAQGYGGGPPVVEGLRFGLALGIFFWTGAGVMRYATESLSGEIALYWVVLGTAQFALIGVLAGLVYGSGNGAEPPPAAGAEMEKQKAA